MPEPGGGATGPDANREGTVVVHGEQYLLGEPTAGLDPHSLARGTGSLVGRDHGAVRRDDAIGFVEEHLVQHEWLLVRRHENWRGDHDGHGTQRHRTRSRRRGVPGTWAITTNAICVEFFLQERPSNTTLPGATHRAALLNRQSWLL